MVKDRMDTICYSCHPGAETRFIKTFTHSPVITGNCQECHRSHRSDNDDLLTNRADDPGLCRKCHGDLLKETPDGFSHPLFTEGRCLTCHEVHGSNIQGMITDDQEALCLSCHKERLGEEIGEVGSEHLPFTKAECTKCHNPHKAGLEHLILAEPPDLCFTCHTGLKDRLFKDEECAKIKEMEDRGIDTAGRGEMCDGKKLYVHSKPDLLDCGRCHRPHFSEEEGLINKPVQQLCMECHDLDTGGFTRAHLNIEPDVMDCRKCHEPHSSEDPKFFRENIHPLFRARACENCHIVKTQ